MKEHSIKRSSRAKETISQESAVQTGVHSAEPTEKPGRWSVCTQHRGAEVWS